ncbi:ABC-2 type transport system permease protein [Sphingomonas jejuensis]|uniref:ABC-2 type transport system permease protein n=1 Tax=Sphingomonas jejuensis TaxID=904715 RepID=A0ABX0XP90_9SPHN|nr:ABC transporter permease [Sphingomonas jejuensis]NJC34672.1 ABC-2 type transport system permease protein [Sphingomonas jejuensis]
MIGRFLRQTLVVARRDFVAIVFTPTFLIFLLAPLLMLGFGAIGGAGAARLAEGSVDRNRVVVIADAATGPRVTAADAGLRTVFRSEEAPPALEIRAPDADPLRQARALFDAGDIEVSAVLAGPIETPQILHGPRGDRSAAYLRQLAERVVLGERAGADGQIVTATLTEVQRSGATSSSRQAAGFFAVFAIFLVTLLLASQAVGMLAEERGNKVIEVLAAAVPLEAVFLGKLLGLFGVAILFIGFWGALGAQGIMLLPPELAVASALQPAIGLPMFALLFIVYFIMAFLILSAIFLGVGAQASTMREIQMLSLPITMLQLGMFALSAAAAGNPGAPIARVAELFPLSSPFAMAARAANDASLWPHLLAIAWQLLWVMIVIWLGARLFRVGVLKSGGGLSLPFRRKKPVAEPSS